jgi:hypothetical protein
MDATLLQNNSSILKTVMRLFLCAILIIVTVSCLDEYDNYVKRTDIVHISETLIPDTSKNLEIVQIKAKAEETNGCWSDLYFVLDKKSEFEYRLKALGTFESNGICPTVMVYQDTIIEFIPTQKGTYFFQIIQSKDKIRTDTLYVE